MQVETFLSFSKLQQVENKFKVAKKKKKKKIYTAVAISSPVYPQNPF